MSLVGRIKELNLKDNDGLEAARRILLEFSRDHLISELINRIEEPKSQDKMSSEEVADIEGLFDAISEHNLFLERPKSVEVVPWNEIKDVDREWLLPNWLPANTVTMFTGQGGAGKSWLTLQVICQITGGFLDLACLNPDVSTNTDPGDPYNVVLATYEDEPAEIKRRLQALASGMSWVEETLDTIKQHLYIVDMRGIGSIWGPGAGNHISNTGDLLAVGESLRKVCEDNKARLLVIDPLSGTFGGNENDRTAVYDFVSSFRKWGDTAKCAMLMIGHLPKYTDGKSAGFSGSTAWEASVRSMWMLSIQKSENNDGKKNGNDYWALSHMKSNYAPLQPTIPLVKSGTGWWKRAANTEDAIEGLKEYMENINSLSQEDTEDDETYKNISN